MKTSRKIAIIAGLVVLAAAVVMAVLFLTGRMRLTGRGSGTQPTVRVKRPYLVQKNADTSAVKYHQDASEAKAKERVRAVPRRFAAANEDGIFRDSDGKPYSQADQKIMSAAAAAINKDDLELARSIAEKALVSDNVELREAVVDALGWFGESAMVELTPFLSDPDAGIASAASSHWKDALQEIEDDGIKAGVIEKSLNVLADKDLLEDVANELIGIDELAAVQVIANVMESGNEAAIAAVQEAYDSITGEKWNGLDAAEAWLQENYVPDDDDDE